MPNDGQGVRRRSDRRLRIVVGGYVGLLPSGGVTWDYVQYPAGLAALGHDVFYVEDTRQWPVFQDATDGTGTPDACAENVRYLAAAMDAFGLADRWAYRDEVSGRCFGLTEGQVRDVCRSADVFVNVSCSTALRDEYRAIPTRVLVDTDPMFTQVQCAAQTSYTPGRPAMRELFDAHTHHFTFAENLGAPDCRVPDCGVTWLPTRKPISLRHWQVRPLPPAPAGFTTVMNWAAGRDLEYAGERWGQKDRELLRVLDLPRRVPEVSLTLAMGQTGGTGVARFPRDLLAAHGWRVTDAAAAAPDWAAYQRFITASAGEFSVAKDGYVKGRTGWFSGRSGCYLASGRPVVAQDTGWSRYLPAGRGALAFDDLEGAVDAVRQVAADPRAHAHAAREIAEAYFDGDLVLRSLLDRVGA